jgi:hypothetical protein
MKTKYLDDMLRDAYREIPPPEGSEDDTLAQIFRDKFVYFIGEDEDDLCLVECVQQSTCPGPSWKTVNKSKLPKCITEAIKEYVNEKIEEHKSEVTVLMRSKWDIKGPLNPFEPWRGYPKLEKDDDTTRQRDTTVFGGASHDVD